MGLLFLFCAAAIIEGPEQCDGWLISYKMIVEVQTYLETQIYTWLLGVGEFGRDKGKALRKKHRTQVIGLGVVQMQLWLIAKNLLLQIMAPS